MLKNEVLALAMSDVSEQYILDAQESLGYLGRRSRGWSRGKRLRRTLLIAAVIASLLTVSAAAAGLPGLQRRISRGPGENALGAEGYLSFSGDGDTPEGRAAAEWADYAWSNMLNGGDGQAWTPGNEEERNLQIVYGIHSQAMLDKLREIAKEQGLALHERCYMAPNQEDFFRMADVPFPVREADYFFAEYIYEDGGFKCEGELTLEGIPCHFTLLRERAGVLTPTYNTISNPQDYDQWIYTTSAGDPVELAVYNKPLPEWETVHNYLFYRQGDWTITVLGMAPVGREGAEAFADRFDFSGLCSGTPQVTAVSASRDIAPTVAQDPGDAMDFSAFLATPEYRASQEFSESYRRYWNTVGVSRGYEQFEGVYGHGYGQLDREELIKIGLSGFGDESVDQEILRVCEKYGLRYPAYKEFWVNNTAYPYVWNGGYSSASADSRPMSTADKREQLAQGDFLPEDWFDAAWGDWYDTGAFIMRWGDYDVYYLPKGTLFTLVPELDELEHEEHWMYKTASGPVVCCGGGVLLYESDNAYVLVSVFIHDGEGAAYALQKAADTVDFTQFR